MRSIVLFLLLLLTPQARAQTFVAKEARQVSLFFGTWEGKWNGGERIRFTITASTLQSGRGPRAPQGDAWVKCEMEEQVGQPMSFQSRPAWLDQGHLRVLGGVDILLSANDQKAALAKENSGLKRTASLKKR